MTVVLKYHLSTTTQCLFVISTVEGQMLCLETPPCVMWLAKNVLLSRQSSRNGTAGGAELLLWAGSHSNVHVTLRVRIKTLNTATNYFQHSLFLI